MQAALKAAVKKDGVTAFCRRHGFDTGNVCAMLAGRRPVARSVQRVLGLKIVETVRRMK